MSDVEEFRHFWCSCTPEGRDACEQMYQQVLADLHTDDRNLLTTVVTTLWWDFLGVITSIPTDQWSAVRAEKIDYDDDGEKVVWRTYIQCDHIEYGIAGTFQAFREKYPDKFSPPPEGSELKGVPRAMGEAAKESE